MWKIRILFLLPITISFYGSKGETLLVGMKPVYDGGAVSKYVANIECSNWPSKDNVSSGQVYVEYETLEGSSDKWSVKGKKVIWNLIVLIKQVLRVRRQIGLTTTLARLLPDDKVKQNSVRNKGLFSTEEALHAAVPSPVVGDWAVGGVPYPVLYMIAR